MEPLSKVRLRNGVATALRSSSCIQVDLDPKHAVLLSGDVVEIRNFLNDLDGRYQVQALIKKYGFADEFLDLMERRGLLTCELINTDSLQGLTQLQRSNLITSATCQTAATGDAAIGPNYLKNLSDGYVWINGVGPVAGQLSIFLAQAQIGRLKIDLLNSFQFKDLPIWIRRTGGDPVGIFVDELERASSRIQLNQPKGLANPDLAILTDDPFRDPASTDSFMNRQIPHLFVDVLASHAVVGPLVLPGISACLNCIEQKFLMSDQAWPSMREILGPKTHIEIDNLLMTLSASFAANIIVGLITSKNFERSALINSQWRFSLPGPSLEVVRFEPDPTCHCQWGLSVAA